MKIIIVQDTKAVMSIFCYFVIGLFSHACIFSVYEIFLKFPGISRATFFELSIF